MAKCEHDGMIFETLHWKYFVKCEICGKWRLRRRRDIFWKWTPRYFRSSDKHVAGYKPKYDVEYKE